jgi:hypothetical protein
LRRELTPFAVAQHEAAHICVGLSVGVRLIRKAEVCSYTAADLEGVGPAEDLGGVWFLTRSDPASALTFAAGIAWDKAQGHRVWPNFGDDALLRQIAPSVSDRRAYVRAASAILRALGPEHEALTAALLERPLTHADAMSVARHARKRPRPKRVNV